MNTTPTQSANIDVARICQLAHFALSQEEQDRFQNELSSIVEYVNKLSELDLDGIEPTQYGQRVSCVLREDSVEPSLDHDAAMQIAADAANDEFRMPKIVE